MYIGCFKLFFFKLKYVFFYDGVKFGVKYTILENVFFFYAFAFA